MLKIYVSRRGKKLGRNSSMGDSHDFDKTNAEMSLLRKTGMTGSLNDKQIWDKFKKLSEDL